MRHVATRTTRTAVAALVGTVAGLALSLTGGSAEAAPAPKWAVSVTDPATACIVALKAAKGHPNREDHATVVCSKVRTQKQADKVYRWAADKPWALAILG